MEGIVTFNDWNKLDLRVAEILEVEEIPEADKLYKLKIDLGTETRDLVAGLKQHYTKTELEGKRVIVFTNLEPKKLKGIESQGMVLAAVNDDHSEIKLLQVDGVVPLGSKVS
jgi:methionyl-tRNA synthetase